MQTTTRLAKPIFLVEAAPETNFIAKPYLFMLCNRIGGNWYVENRYRTKAALDRAMEVFAEEFKADNDGYAPKLGKDYLACKAEDYNLADDNTGPDYDAIMAGRREAVTA